MTQSCYNPILQPDFFATTGDCENILHDIQIVDGQLRPVADAAIAAIIIQLGTDKVLANQRGFWGDQFVGFPLGTHAWTLTDNVEGETNTLRVRADEYIREALQELISQGFFDAVEIRTVEVVDGFELTVNVTRDGETLATFGLTT